jgi:hypothetical protein
MRHRKTLSTVILLATLGVGTLFAQPDTSKAVGAPPPSAGEGERLLGEMESIYSQVLRLQSVAHSSKDIVKINCVNEKLVAVKALLNIAEDTKHNLDAALSRDDGTAQAQLSQLEGTHAEAVTERDGAQACMGENLGRSEAAGVRVQRPAIPDDPTDDRGPFEPTNSLLDIERPAFATPW